MEQAAQRGGRVSFSGDRIHLDTSLCDLLHGSCFSRDWTAQSLEVPSNPYKSVILYGQTSPLPPPGPATPALKHHIRQPQPPTVLRNREEQGPHWRGS